MSTVKYPPRTAGVSTGSSSQGFRIIVPGSNRNIRPVRYDQASVRVKRLRSSLSDISVSSRNGRVGKLFFALTASSIFSSKGSEAAPGLTMVNGVLQPRRRLRQRPVPCPAWPTGHLYAWPIQGRLRHRTKARMCGPLRRAGLCKETPGHHLFPSGTPIEAP